MKNLPQRDVLRMLVEKLQVQRKRRIEMLVNPHVAVCRGQLGPGTVIRRPVRARHPRASRNNGRQDQNPAIGKIVPILRQIASVVFHIDDRVLDRDRHHRLFLGIHPVRLFVQRVVLPGLQIGE